MLSCGYYCNKPCQEGRNGSLLKLFAHIHTHMFCFHHTKIDQELFDKNNRELKTKVVLKHEFLQTHLTSFRGDFRSFQQHLYAALTVEYVIILLKIAF